MKQFVIVIICIVFVGCKSNIKTGKNSITQVSPAKVTLIKTKGKHQIMVNNKPFYIKGAGLEYGNIEALSKHGANSFRTWRVENGKQTGLSVLEEAHRYGLMVTMGIDVARERHGFNYNDTLAVKNQMESIKRDVIALKDQPALLMWDIGNELNLHSTNPKVWNAVNNISKMIHSIDPNHLTTTSIAGISQNEVNLIKERCPDLDLLAVQMYGDLPNLPKLIKDFGWEKPYIITEWGATGHWEVPKTLWGAPIEENSTIKAANYLKRYQTGIEKDSMQCLGSYVFLWGQKQERTPTWYGVFLENGEETESIDVMHFIWNGKWPSNRTPQIESFILNTKVADDNITLQPNKDVVAEVKIHDFENDSITYSWEILPESTDLQDGGDHERRPQSVLFNIIKQEEGKLVFKTPSAGMYRLFVYADDGYNHAATANIPFLIKK